MSKLSDFVVGPAGGGAYSTPIAGRDLAANDAVLIGPKGKAVPARVTDYAAVGTKGFSLLPKTSIGAAQASLDPQMKAVQCDDGCFIVPAADGAGTQFTLSKYTAAGVLVRVSATYGVGAGVADLKIFRLVGSTNFALVCQGYVAVFDQNLNAVSAPAASGVGDDSTTSGSLDAIPLSGGGFAVCARNTATQKLAIFSNAGAAVLAATTIQAWTGTAGNVYAKLAELSSGNVAIAMCSKYATTKGLYHAIYTQAGVAVVASANLDTSTPTDVQAPTLLAVAGYYHIASPAGAKVYVRTNAGAAQTNYALASNTGSSNVNWALLVSDGTYVWCVYWRSTLGQLGIYKTDLLGAAVANGYLTGWTAGSNPNPNIDGYLDAASGLLVLGFQIATQPYYGVLDLVGFAPYTPMTAIGTSVTSGGTYTGVTDLGDGVFAMVFDQASAAGTFVTLIKAFNTGVAGVAAGAAAAGATVSVNGNVGTFACNALKGSASVLFDHIAGPVPGVLGALALNALQINGSALNIYLGRIAINQGVSTAVSYTVPAGKIIREGRGYNNYGSGPNTLSVNGVTVAVALASAALTTPWSAGPGDVISSSASGGSIVGITGVLENA